jgi:hypothetical protein
MASQWCARKLLASRGIVSDVYLNLEGDLHLTKEVLSPA